MADENLPIPIEVPWQLAGSTRPLGAAPDLPADITSLSLFTYVPEIESLDTDYPNERLIYLKFTVSVSPFAPRSKRDPILDLVLGTHFPIWGMLFDVRVFNHAGIVPGAIRPYFLAASPTERNMIESGVVGDQSYEGASNGIAIGKSGSQLHEVFNSTTKISKSSAGLAAGGMLGPVLIGGGVSHTGSTTSISGSRDVVESHDTTNREASVERRELFSHLTNANNVLSLLKTHLVGSPYLRFLLRPLPLRQLSMDPSDPFLWYSEFVKRRSNGIEGMQDFYAVLVVPRDMVEFCLEAKLTRAYINEPPLPVNPDEHEPEKFDPQNIIHWFQIVLYLNRIYPPGTPVEELDVDIFETPRIPPLPVQWDQDALEEWWTDVDDILAPANPFPEPSGALYRGLAEWFKIVADILAPGQVRSLPPGNDFTQLEWWRIDLEKLLADVQRIPRILGMPRPVIASWQFSGFVPRVTLRILAQPPTTQQFGYKWPTEVWLEWKRVEYEEEAARSPLLRGQPTLTPPTSLRTCFSLSPEGSVTPITEKPPNPIPIRPSILDLRPANLITGIPRRVNGELGRHATFCWNALESNLAAALASNEAPKELRMDAESSVDLFLKRSESMQPGDPQNESFDQLLKWVYVPAGVIKKLREMKLTDLRSLAAAINSAPFADQQLTPLPVDKPRSSPTQSPAAERKARQQTFKLPSFLITPEEALSIKRSLGKALQARFEKSLADTTSPPAGAKRTANKRQPRKQTKI